MKKQDAVKSVQLAIKAPLLNSESKPSNDSSKIPRISQNEHHIIVLNALLFN